MGLGRSFRHLASEKLKKCQPCHQWSKVCPNHYLALGESMNFLHQLDPKIWGKPSYHLFPPTRTLTHLPIMSPIMTPAIMGYKSAPRSEQYVEWV